MSGSLFEEQTKSGSNVKIVLIAVVALLAMVGAGYGVFRYTSPADMLASEILESMVFMLAQPSFSGEEFRYQLLENGRITKYAWRKKEAYFTFPEIDEADFQNFLGKHIIDVGKVDFGKLTDEHITLDEYVMRTSPAANQFFKTTTDNIRLDTKSVLSFPFSTVIYSVSPNELRNMANSSQLYGGRMITRAPERKDEPQIIFANHGMMVAKPGEPSLKRFTDELLKDVADSREARIQRLVDFVSNEIEYSYTEAVAATEKLKRPSETLMTRSADCSNKTILLASLLEQIGEEYILLYCPRHITVAVPLGGFTNENKLDFTWDQKPWLIAESTAPGFMIGQSMLAEPTRVTTVQYVQDPKLPDVIYDANSYETLKFY